MDQKQRLARLPAQLIPVLVFVLLLVGTIAGWGLARSKFRAMSSTDFQERYEDLVRQVSVLQSAVTRKVQANEIALEFNVRTIAQAEELEPGVVAEPMTGAAPGLNLTGISWNEGQPLAFINGEILGVEDEISGYKVVKIMEESITMRDGEGGTRVLSLYD